MVAAVSPVRTTETDGRPDPQLIVVALSRDDLRRLDNGELVVKPDDTPGPVRLVQLHGSATRVALTGGEFDATLDGVPVWSHWSFPVRAGQTLKLGSTNAAARPGGMRACPAKPFAPDVLTAIMANLVAARTPRRDRPRRPPGRAARPAR